MSEDLDKQLRNALRPLKSADDLAGRVLARIDADKRRAIKPRFPQQRFAWIPASLAASLVVAIVGHHQWQQHREQEALKAKQQLIEALRVTSAKLDLAYQAVRGTDQES